MQLGPLRAKHLLLFSAGRAGGARRTAHRLVERAGRSQEHAREHAASLRKGGEGGARAERLATGALGATTCERAWKEAHDPAGRSRLVVAFAGAACRTDCAPAMLRSHGWCVARVTPTVQSVTLRVATAWSWSSRAAVGSWGGGGFLRPNLEPKKSGGGELLRSGSVSWQWELKIFDW